MRDGRTGTELARALFDGLYAAVEVAREVAEGRGADGRRRRTPCGADPDAADRFDELRGLARELVAGTRAALADARTGAPNPPRDGDFRRSLAARMDALAPASAAAAATERRRAAELLGAAEAVPRGPAIPPPAPLDAEAVVRDLRRRADAAERPRGRDAA